MAVSSLLPRLAERDDQDRCEARAVPARRLRIAFLIDRLNHAGAARQLVLLARALHDAGHSVIVIVFYDDDNPLESELRTAGIRVRSLGKRSRWEIVRFYRRALRAVRQEEAEVLHSYLGVPNLFAVALKAGVRSTKIVWAVRASDTRMQWYGWIPRILEALSPALSRYADLIVANSFAGRAYIVTSGYPPDKVIVIPNGIETACFIPSAEGRARFRERLGLGPAVPLVGIVGRLDPIKDHPTFLRAARIVAARTDARFVCVGDGPDTYRRELQDLAAQLGIEARVLWVPSQSNMTDVYNGLDVLASSSVSEGFPNVVAEAMACGVPCVVTDVGDSARVAGRYGCTVPARDPRALADGIHQVLTIPPGERPRMADARRAWVGREFSCDRLLRASERALGSLLKRHEP
jgi:glycosyltransferase involved in cell wall biosynthesis